MADNNRINEIAAHMFGEFQVYFPHGMDDEAVETMACIVAIFTQMKAVKDDDKWEKTWRDFDKTVRRWVEGDE